MRSMSAIPARRQIRAPGVTSAVGRLAQCSLQCRIERAEKPGSVPLGQRSRSAGIGSELPQVLGYFTTGKGVTYIPLRPLFAGRRDDTRALFKTARCQRDIRGDASSAAEMYSAIQSSAASALSPTKTILTFEVPGGRIGREPLETTKTLSRRRAATR